MTEKGTYYVLEGADGSGKTTQAKHLVSKLEEMGRKVLLVREPGGTEVGEDIREVILHKKSPRNLKVEALLFYASRAQLVYEKIKPALDSGIDVVSERNNVSTLVYQTLDGKDDTFNLSEVKKLNNIVLKGYHKADKMVILDVSFEAAAKRRKDAGKIDDNIERRGKDFHEKNRKVYFAYAAVEGIPVVDASKSEQRVRDAIFDALKLH